MCYSGRSGKSYAVAALASSANKSENESAKANGSEAPKIKAKKISRAQRRDMVEAFVLKYDSFSSMVVSLVFREKNGIGTGQLSERDAYCY